MSDASANNPAQPEANVARPSTCQPYRVLARKYRPGNFTDLIGQDHMVRTLSNAIESQRLAHAFVLTGVRGVGKTTTARIIARALNCVGPDGTSGPTIAPCGKCANCAAIAEDRHADVLEMDAASRTGVEDIRELIDGVRYLPVQARFKIYIIDEVHMLSRNAFNALLKTLEEPPEHVKFLFATTEIRKVPITVLSRCQRFDLRRIQFEALMDHLRRICAKEGIHASDDGLAAITRAAEGSVRDSLSMLDQAIAYGDGTVSADQVRQMLGLADRGRAADLFESIMSGDTASAMAELRDQYNAGADPAVCLSDLLEYSHLLSRIRAAPNSVNEVSDDVDMDRAKDMAQKLSMPSLTRAWQVLLKGVEETRMAPSAIAAAEMTIIRLAYASTLPSPADLVRHIKQNGGGGTAAGPSNSTPSSHAANDGESGRQVRLAGDRNPDGYKAATFEANSFKSAGGGQSQVTRAMADPPPDAVLNTIEDVVELARENKELKLVFDLKEYLHLVSFNGPRARMEVRPSERAPQELISTLTTKLRKWTNQNWIITISAASGAATLHQKQEATQASLLQEATDHPLVAKVLAVFPGARIDYVEEIHSREAEDMIVCDEDSFSDDQMIPDMMDNPDNDKPIA